MANRNKTLKSAKGRIKGKLGKKPLKSVRPLGGIVGVKGGTAH